MGNPNSKLIPKNPRKRKLCDFENYSTEFPPKKRLKAISNHGNSSAELSYIVLDDDSSSELSSLPTTPSRDSTPAEFDKTVAKSSPPKQPNLISEHKTDHAKCGAEPHDNNAETGEPPQPENLHPSPESNTHHSNPLAQHPNSVKVQPQEQKELNPISKDNTVHSNATAQPDVVVDQIKNLLEGVLQDGQKHNSVSEQTACYTNSAALFRELESSLVQAILQFNFGHRSAAAPVNDLLDSLRQGIEHFNSVYKHVTKRRNSAAQIYDILGNLLPQVEELHSLSDDDSVTRVCDLVRFTMEELSQSHPVSTNNVSRRKSTIHANDTGMQDVHTQPPARPKPDPGYNIPVVRSNGFSILEVGRNAASQYQLINGNL